MNYRIRVGSLWRAQRFRRLLLGSVGCHVLVVGVGFVGLPFLRPAPRMPPAIMVRVMEAAPSAPAPAPAPAEAPRPPRQEVEEAVVIPEQPRPKPKPPKKPEPEKKVEPEKPPEKPPEPTKSAAELMAELRQQADEIETPATGQPQEGQGLVDPEVGAYLQKIKACMRTNWVGATQYQRRRNLFVRMRVRVTASGVVESVDLAQPSGIRAFDESAQRAVLKCSPLPPPPSGNRVIPIVFVPGDI